MKLHGTYAFDEALATTIATALNASYSDKESGSEATAILKKKTVVA